MIVSVSIIAGVLITIFLIYATTRPDTFQVQRSIGIIAQPDKIFPFINDFHQWLAWSPWEHLGPVLKRAYSGAPQGKGAVYEWDGNKQVGTGRMEIVGGSAPTRIVIKLDFFKPLEAHNMAEFILTPKAGSTEVTWTMYGPQPFRMRVMGVFCNLDKMVGGQFEKGLSSLKALAEK